MFDITRRSFIGGVIAAMAAPAIIRTSGLVMPIKPLWMPEKTIVMQDEDAFLGILKPGENWDHAIARLRVVKRPLRDVETDFLSTMWDIKIY